MFDKLRDQIVQDLTAHRVGVLSAATEAGPQAMPVRYITRGLAVDCLLPRWSDLAFYLEDGADVLLVVLMAQDSDQRWVRCRGEARPLPDPDWAALAPDVKAPAELYLAVRIQPSRIDVIDEGRGWGARETLDIE